MAENIDIEAKLCSYVEGDLDAASRAEIERYLQAHPQYREVLAELISERGELRALPRVRAPMDVQENISGQLERSALLGDGDPLRGTGRTTGFPYFRAWAAIIVLAAALSAVIYSVLPARKAKLNELATLTTNPSQLDEKASVAATAPADADATPNPTVIAMAAPSTAPLADTAAMPSASAAEVNALPTAKPTTQMQAAVAQIAMVSQSLPPLRDTSTTQTSASAINTDDHLSQQASAANAVILPTADLSAAESQVHQYLQSQNYSYATSVEHVSDGSAASNGSMSSNTSSSMSGASATVIAGNVRAIAAPEVHTIIVHQLTNAQLMQTRMAVESLPQTNSVMFSKAQPANQFQFATPPALAMQSSSPTATTLPLGGETDLQPGQRIQVMAEDTGLGGVAAMDETMTIDPDGNIALPLIGKTRAAGLTPTALSRSIALNYEIAKSPTRATWTVRPAPANSLTIESNKLALIPAASTAFDSTQPVAAAIPTKAMSVSTTQPSMARQSLAPNRMISAGQGGVTLQRDAMAARSATTNPSSGSAPLATTMPSGGSMVMSATMPSASDVNEPRNEPRNDLTIILVQTGSPTTAPAMTAAPATTAPAAAYPASAAPTTMRSPTTAR